MAFRNFDYNVTLRIAFLMLTLSAVSYLLVATKYYVAISLLFLLAVFQFYYLLNFVKTTNREISRFLGAVRNSDFSQTFTYNEYGRSFAELGDAFTGVLDRFRATRSEKEEHAHYLRILVDHIPVALISIDTKGRVEPLNNAARRMFSPSFPTQIDQFSEYGDELGTTLHDIESGETRRVKISQTWSEQQLKIAATEIVVGGERQRILSLQDIQSDLDAREYEAWRDLGRVLTHELMNSLTPVSSLASTALDLLGDVNEKLEDRDSIKGDLIDARDAVSAVARRSEGLLNFVDNYRQVMRVPPPEISRFRLSDVCDGIERLMHVDLESRGISHQCIIEPNELELDADPDLLEQALINLVKNASDAVTDTVDPAIAISARISERGRVVISIHDNGPGIPPDVLERIFVPFYTTKKEGAGIGLSLSRQIMLAHKGGIDVESKLGEGTTINLRFP